MRPAPVEIGNRVWRDTNSNGRQDAGEAGISGVVVGLYNSAGTLIAQVTTDTNGYFLFSSAGGDANDVPGKNYGVAIPTGVQYTVAVFNSSFSSGQPLFNLYRTVSNFDGQTNNAAFTDIRDSDAIGLSPIVASAGNVAYNGVILLATVIAGSGYNNDSVDFGFTSTPTAVDMGDVSAVVNQDATVGIHWETFSELTIVGFNLLRGSKKDGPFIRVNEAMIEARSVGGLTGNVYTFTDDTVQVGKRYFDSVELFRPNGSSERTDAVKVRVRAAGCAAKPGAAAPVDPADGTVVKKGKVVFTWNPALCAVRYKWQLRLDSAEGKLVASKKELTSATTSIKKLVPGRTYVWRVMSCNASDKCTSGSWLSFAVQDKQ